jgi:hypothetical protein
VSASCLAPRVACSLAFLIACGDDAPAMPEAQDAAPRALPPPPAIALFDAATRPDPFDFEPAEPPAPIAAHGDAGPPHQAPVDAMVAPPAGDCIAIAPGTTVTLTGDLDAESTWLRIAPDTGCPATRVTSTAVAYQVHGLCPAEASLSLEIVMRGADMLASPPREAVADPMLVVYEREEQLELDPFGCLATNDDGTFTQGSANSARIEALPFAAGDSAVVIATSYERPDQRGVGAYELTLRAR